MRIRFFFLMGGGECASYLREDRPHSLVHEGLVRLVHDRRQRPVVVQEEHNLVESNGVSSLGLGLLLPWCIYRLCW